MPVASSKAFIDSENFTPSASLPSKAPSTVTVVPEYVPLRASSKAPPGITSKLTSGIDGSAGAAVGSSGAAVGSAGADVGSDCAGGASVVGVPQAANAIEATINMVRTDQNIRDVFMFLLSFQIVLDIGSLSII
jgi:hypothetical protein